jgi:DNA polymerase I
MAICWALGVDVAEPFGCTLVGAFNHDNSRRSYSLANVCEYYGVPPAVDFDELTKKGKRTMDSFSAEEVAGYSIPHSENTLKIYKKIERSLKASGQWVTYSEIDVPCIPSVVWIESSGVNIDFDYVEELRSTLSDAENSLENEIMSMAGKTFNVRSNPQLCKVLFRDLRLPILKQRKTGPSTDKTVLSELAKTYPIAAKLLEYREVQKLNSTFINALYKFEVDSRVYTRIHMAVARSGRFSSSQPNLQNIPHFDKYGIRHAFCAPKGSALAVADFSQIEMRVAAIFSGDPELVDIYTNNDDIHSRTCMALFGEVTPEKRTLAKTVNFAVGYGMGTKSLAAKLKISENKAAIYLNKYWETYRRLQSFNSQLVNIARFDGCTRTLSGRRRMLPFINKGNYVAAEDERIATNHPIQGTAADILKMAQTGLYNRFKNTDVKCVLTVHDELVLEGPDDGIDDILREQIEIMSTAGGRINFGIPLLVEGKTGRTWGECH